MSEPKKIHGLSMDEGMKKTVKDTDWIALATRGCAGESFHLIAVWNAVILDSSTLGFFAGGMFATSKNLEREPYLEALIVSKKHNIGYRFTGNGKMMGKKDLDQKIADKMHKANQKFWEMSHSVLLFSLETATKLI